MFMPHMSNMTWLAGFVVFSAILMALLTMMPSFEVQNLIKQTNNSHSNSNNKWQW